MSLNLKRWLICSIIALSCIAISLYLYEVRDKVVKHILVIQSYEPNYGPYIKYNSKLIKYFRDNGIKAIISTKYVDCESYFAQEELKHTYDLLESSKDFKPDLIIVNDDQATYDVLSCGHPLSYQVPIVFTGVNYPNWNKIRQHQNVTGYYDKIELLKNINFMKEIYHLSKIKVFTVMDSTFIDMKIMEDTRRQLKGTRFVGLNTPNIPVKEQENLYNYKGYSMIIKYKSRMYDDNTKGYFLWPLYAKDFYYLELKRDFTTINIGNMNSNPSFNAINEEFDAGKNLIGGYFTTIEEQALEGTIAAMKIFKGIAPSKIPITYSKKEYTIDWKSFKKGNMTESDIPSYCNIVNYPFYKRYTNTLICIAIAILIFCIIAFVRLNRRFQSERFKRKEISQALEKESERLMLAVQNEDMFVWGLHDDVLILENSFWKKVGVEPKELGMQFALSLINPQSRVKFEKEKHDIIDGKIKHIELQCNFGGEKYEWWDFRFTKFKKEHGKYQTTGLIKYIEPQKQKDKRVEEAQEIIEKVELKQSFFDHINNKLELTLQENLNLTQKLSNDNLPKDIKGNYVNKINDNERLILKMISEISLVTQIKSRELDMNNEDCMLNDIITQAYENKSKSCAAKKLSFIKEEPKQAGLVIEVDPMYMKQVIEELIENAVKFTNQGSIHILQEYDQDRGLVKIHVEDTGIGIPPEAQTLIFEPFAKVTNSSQNIGLGLTICKMLIESWKGKLDVASTPYEGSRFTITLPAIVKEKKQSLLP